MIYRGRRRGNGLDVYEPDEPVLFFSPPSYSVTSLISAAAPALARHSIKENKGRVGRETINISREQLGPDTQSGGGGDNTGNT